MIRKPIVWAFSLGSKESTLSSSTATGEPMPLLPLPRGLPPGLVEVECRQAFTEVYFSAPFERGQGGQNSPPVPGLVNPFKTDGLVDPVRLGPAFSRTCLELPFGTEDCEGPSIEARLFDLMDQDQVCQPNGTVISGTVTPQLLVRYYPGLRLPPTWDRTYDLTMVTGDGMADLASFGGGRTDIGYPPGYARVFNVACITANLVLETSIGRTSTLTSQTSLSANGTMRTLYVHPWHKLGGRTANSVAMGAWSRIPVAGV